MLSAQRSSKRNHIDEIKTGECDMGAVKQWMIEDAEKESEAEIGLCVDCGRVLIDDEIECDMPFCFDCYIQRHI